MDLKLIQFSDLNARQKENFNYQKFSAVLADYGYVTLRLSDDWQGADFIAQHIDGATFLRVQLKSRLSFDKKFQGKGLYIAFPDPDRESEWWYLYPHDELLGKFPRIEATEAWIQHGSYTFASLGKEVR